MPSPFCFPCLFFNVWYEKKTNGDDDGPISFWGTHLKPPKENYEKNKGRKIRRLCRWWCDGMNDTVSFQNVQLSLFCCCCCYPSTNMYTGTSTTVGWSQPKFGRVWHTIARDCRRCSPSWRCGINAQPGTRNHAGRRCRLRDQRDYGSLVNIFSSCCLKRK